MFSNGPVDYYDPNTSLTSCVSGIPVSSSVPSHRSLQVTLFLVFHGNLTGSLPAVTLSLEPPHHNLTPYSPFTSLSLDLFSQKFSRPTPLPPTPVPLSHRSLPDPNLRQKGIPTPSEDVTQIYDFPSLFVSFFCQLSPHPRPLLLSQPKFQETDPLDNSLLQRKISLKLKQFHH